MERIHFRYYLEYALAITTIKMLELMPYTLRIILLCFFFVAALTLMPIRAIIILKNIKRVTGRYDVKILTGFILHFAKLIDEFFIETEQNYMVTGIENIDNHLSKKPVFLITGHFGNWEAVGRYLAKRGYKLFVVARRIKNPLIEKMVRNLRESRGMKVIYDDGALIKIVRRLKKGNVFGFLIDHKVSNGVRVNFFGDVIHPDGVARMSKKYDIPVLPLFNKRKGNKIHIMIGSRIESLDIMDEINKENEILKEFLLEAKEQWLWIHNRWNE